MKSPVGKSEGRHISLKIKIVIPTMLAILAVLLIAATAFGTVSVPFGNTVQAILKNWGILENVKLMPGQEQIIFYARFPRVVVAVLVGAALAASGAVMQGVFRNPMADPGILGVSSGAGLGAVTAIALGLSARSMYYMPLFAATGALLAAATIFILSARKGRTPTLTLILSGIAVSTFIGAITSIILTKVNDYQVKVFIFWTMGGLRDRNWDHFRLVLPVLLLIALLFTFARDLNVMLLGEEEAQAVGLNPSRTRIRLLILVSITTAIAVSVSGSISFVGLIVPHIMRLLVGPDHRILLPASTLGGAIFLVGCDLIARIVVIPSEVEVGIITSLIGAPYFLYLLIRARKEGGDL